MAYPVTDEFRNALRYGHKVATLAQVCDTDGDVLATLEPLAGQVTVDVDRMARREAGDLQLVDSTGDLTPLDVDDLLNPLNGYEIRLYRGIEFVNNSSQILVPLGVFGYTGATVEDSGAGVTFSLSGLVDRSERISRARYATPVRVSSDTATETVITTILQQAWEAVPFAGGQLPTTGTTVPVAAFGVEGDSDPWRDAVQIAESKGYRLYFDANGQVAMSQVVDDVPTTATVEYGGTDLLVLSMTRAWDTADTYNGIMAVGERTSLRTGVIPKFTAWDDNQDSPTYYLGPFGKRLRVYSSSLITNNADAARAARLQLARTRGVAEKLAWAQIVDPSLDVDDAVQVTQASVGADAIYLISRLTIPLSPSEPMMAESKQRRLT